jgi:hypothetical protein
MLSLVFLGHKTQKRVAARSAATLFWVLIRLYTSGDSYTQSIDFELRFRQRFKISFNKRSIKDFIYPFTTAY